MDIGLPVPDIALFWPATGSPVTELFQQSMPGLSNTPQTFARFDRDLPFFVNIGFGSRLVEVNWFAADGVPILPVDEPEQALKGRQQNSQSACRAPCTVTTVHCLTSTHSR